MAKIFTLGYAVAASEETLDELMSDPRMILVDIRKSTYSRWRPAFNKPALQHRFKKRYLHCAGLGNIHYKEKHLPIVLAAPDEPLRRLCDLLHAGYSLVLLCACAHYQTCHRRVVYDLLQKELSR